MSSPSQRISLTLANRDTARRLEGALINLIYPPPLATAMFETADGGAQVDAYFDDAPSPMALRVELANLLQLPAQAIGEIVVEDVPDENWVSLSQAALPPVEAGRFTIHGSHDAGRVAQGPGALQIDAGEAFGTAHHATTFGCLLAIDKLTRQTSFKKVLDLGCGSGVLALATHRVLPKARITGTDNDATAIEVARDNAKANRASANVEFFVAEGVGHPVLRRQRFDLIIANILAGPLILLARDIAHALKPGGQLVLSGLLVPQAPAVIAAYRAAGFHLVHHARIYEWSTLTLRRGNPRPPAAKHGSAKLHRPPAIPLLSVRI